MKLFSMLAISASLFAEPTNAFLSFDRDENLHEIVILYYQGHYYEIDELYHLDLCPCQK